jgi:PST family polysaccharide transporter
LFPTRFVSATSTAGGVQPSEAVGVIDYFGDHTRHDDHTGRSVRSGAMSVVARAITALIQIGSVLFLARLLTPEDYGLVSMVLAITGFAPLLTDLGTQDAITQAPRITVKEVSALFWITIAVGCGFAFVVAASGPIIARFYGEPRLTGIVFASSGTFIACALAVQHCGLMRRALMFWELGMIEAGANVISAVCAIVIALLGYGYWALLVRPVVTPVLYAAGAWNACRWLPGRPAMTDNVKKALKLGLNITGYGLVDFAGRSGDRIAIGSRAGAVTLGHYQNALTVYDNVVNILIAPLHSVAVAGLSKMRDDVSDLRDAWAKALSTSTFYSMPAFGLLAATSQDLIVLLLGPKWSSAGVLLGILALRGIPHTVERTASWLHVTAGRTDRLMRYGVFATGVQVAALACGLPFGPVGIAVAYVVSMFILCVPALAYAGRPLGIGAADVLCVVWRPLVASLASAAFVSVLRSVVPFHNYASLKPALLVIVYVVSYLTIAVGMLGLRAPIRIARVLIRQSFPLGLAPLQ